MGFLVKWENPLSVDKRPLNTYDGFTKTGRELVTLVNSNFINTKAFKILYCWHLKILHDELH